MQTTSEYRALKRRYGGTTTIVVLVLVILALALGGIGLYILMDAGNTLISKLHRPSPDLKVPFEDYEIKYGDVEIPEKIIQTAEDGKTRLVKLAEPENVRDLAEEGVTGYEQFVKDFKKQTGKNWSDYRGFIEGKLEVIDKTEMAAPSLTALEAAIKETSDNAQEEDLKKQLKALSKEATNTDGEIKEAIGKMALVKDTTADMRGKLSDVIRSAEELKGLDPEQSKQKIEALTKQKVPGLLAAVEKLQDADLQKQIQGAKDLYNKAVQSKDKLRGKLAQLEDEFGPQVAKVIKEGEAYYNEVQQTITTMSTVAQAMPAIASGVEMMAAWAAANPWLAAAIVGVLILLAIFKGFGGGDGDGDGEGDGEQSGQGQASGEPFTGIPDPQGDPSVEPNPATSTKPPHVFTELEPQKGTAAAPTIGGKPSGGVLYSPRWDGSDLKLWIDFGDDHGQVLVTIKSTDLPSKGAKDRFAQVRDGVRTINIRSLTAGDPYPVRVTISGLNDPKNGKTQLVTMSIAEDGRLGYEGLE